MRPAIAFTAGAPSVMVVADCGAHVCRNLPVLTAAELEQMKGMNPRSPEEIRQEIEEERVLDP